MQNIVTYKRRARIGFKGILTKTDPELVDLSFASSAYNFTFRGGSLKSDLGIDVAHGYYGDDTQLIHKYPAFSEEVIILNAFPYSRRFNNQRDDRMVVQIEGGKLYYTKIFENDVWHEIDGSLLGYRPCAVNYNYNGKDVLLLASKENKMQILDGDVLTTVDSAPRFSSLAVHYERIYGTVEGKNQVWFSDDFNPENWTVDSTQAGFINFQDEYGEVLRVVSFLNYLFIFREHAIFRLTAYGDQGEFSMKKLFTATGCIIKPSIALCGDKIIFMAEEGLYAFDGYTVSRIGKEIPQPVYYHTVVAAYSDGCYYLAFKFVEGLFDDYGFARNNLLVEYDLEEKTFSILAPYDIRELVAVNLHQATDLIILPGKTERNMLGIVSKRGRIFGVPTKKYYFTAYNSLGEDGIKVIKEITVTTKKPCKMRVKIDGSVTEYDFAGGEMPQTFFVGRSGRKIQFSLTAEDEVSVISPPIVRYEIVR